MTSTAFANTVSFDYASIGNAKIKFQNGHFTFSNSTLAGPTLGWGFQVTNSPLVSLKGRLGGNFTIGAITTVGTLQSAPVTGTGTFSLFDGTKTFSANVQWVDIFTSNFTNGGANVGGVINLTNFAYNGTNPELLEMIQNTEGIITLQFVFHDGTPTLTKLKAATTAFNDAYTGDVISTPEPGSLLLIGSGLLSFVALRRRKSA